MIVSSSHSFFMAVKFGGRVPYPDQPEWDFRPKELFHLEFCTHLLHFYQSTSNNACRAEVFGFPLQLAVQKRTLSYLQNKSYSSFHYKVLLINKDHPEPCSLQKLISILSIQNSQQCRLYKSQIKDLMNDSKEKYARELWNRIKNWQKLTTYQLLQID